MSERIGSGSWKPGANIDIVRSDDGTVRVRMTVRRGEDMATYSDFFMNDEHAFKWAQDIVIAYGRFTPEPCPVCSEIIWPWEPDDEDWINQTCHASCITESHHPANQLNIRYGGGTNWYVECSCGWKQTSIMEVDLQRSVMIHSLVCSTRVEG